MEPFNVHIPIELVAIAVQAACVVTLALVLRHRDDATARRRTLRRAGLAAVALWAVGGICWSGFGLQHRRISAALMPQVITSWPAHEAALVLTGKGNGANARTPVSITALCAVVWALLLWSPLLTLGMRILAVRAALVIQVVSLIAVAVAFLWYGNG